MKTIKQIKNLKAVKNGLKVRLWNAQYHNGNWEYGWYKMEDVIECENDFLIKTSSKFEYKTY